MYRVIATLLLCFLHVSYGVDETDDELAVVTLTDKTFDETTKTGIWMVKFYAVRFYKVNTSITLLLTITNSTALVRTLQTLGTDLRESCKGESS